MWEILQRGLTRATFHFIFWFLLFLFYFLFFFCCTTNITITPTEIARCHSTMNSNRGNIWAVLQPHVNEDCPLLLRSPSPHAFSTRRLLQQQQQQEKPRAISDHWGTTVNRHRLRRFVSPFPLVVRSRDEYIPTTWRRCGSTFSLFVSFLISFFLYTRDRFADLFFFFCNDEIERENKPHERRKVLVFGRTVSNCGYPTRFENEEE